MCFVLQIVNSEISKIAMRPLHPSPYYYFLLRGWAHVVDRYNNNERPSDYFANNVTSNGMSL